jgi:adhesin transport system membrane fusion protein
VGELRRLARRQEEPSQPAEGARSEHSLVVWVLVCGCLAVLLWAALYRIDEVTRATGNVIASNRVQVIQAVDGGVLDRLNVKEGDRVEPGQVLATLVQTRFSASVSELDAKIAALQAQAARLRAEVTETGDVKFPPQLKDFPEVVELQRALFRQRRTGIDAELRTLRVAVKLAQEDAQLVRNLATGGDVSRSEVIRVERALNEADAQLVNRKNKFLQDARTDLAKVEDELAQSTELRVQRMQQLEDSVFKASMAGIVKNVRVTTVGGVLRAGEELMQIVPVDDELIVEAKVRPADIAQIRPGLNASIYFDAFDYTVFGAVSGKVSYVSADTLKEETKAGETAYYRVHVAVGGHPVTSLTGKTLQILPGMTARVDIRTGERSVLNYLLKPLRKTVGEAFGER